MAPSHTILIAGAGIAGLTAALALARAGFRIVVLEAAQRLEESGAGIQLAPNAARVLTGLGLADRLLPHVVAPEAIQILGGRTGREIAHIRLGGAAAARYGAPYWVIHRGDLQRALVEAAAEESRITLRLGTKVAGHRQQADGVTVAATAGRIMLQEQGAALIGADGLWSAVRAGLGHAAAPRFRQRTAWRTTVPAEHVEDSWREPATTLWLGPDAHLVHYPVKAGSAVNVVAIVRDRAELSGWSTEGAVDDLRARFTRWAPAAQAILAAAARWQRWSLYDLPPLPRWGTGAVTLIGDAAHPMLPFVAQGGAMGIEDAAVLAACVLQAPDDLPAAFRAYESARRERTARVARAAVSTGRIYHLKGPLAAARNLAMRLLGGSRLRRRYDWLYDWKPDRVG